VLRALIFGVVASSALIIGAAIGVRFKLPQRLLAMFLAFAAGTLITALAFELFEESFDRGGVLPAGLGFAAGAVVFTLVSAWLDRKVETPADPAGSPKLDTAAASTEPGASPSAVGKAAGLALLAAVTLDGVPENTALGVTLGDENGGGSLVLLVAIFLSNLPESLVGAASMKEQGWSTARVIGTWATCAALLAGAVVFGAGVLAGLSGTGISLPLAFAAGAVVASLADTLMPEAYEKGGPAVALATAAGFLTSFILAEL